MILLDTIQQSPDQLYGIAACILAGGVAIFFFFWGLSKL